MAPKTINDAAIATNDELEEIAKTAGLFETIEVTTMINWINLKKDEILRQLQKTRRELGRLDQSLARLEMLTRHQLGAERSTGKFLAEYAALEGWSLTLMANYIALAAYGDNYFREQRYTRATKYIQGAIQYARNHPRTAAQLQKPVIEALRDQALIFS